jgi:hypothetical protein
MGSASENYEYGTLCAFNYTESIDHDQSAGAFKAWALGGVVTHQTTSPPTGYAVYFRHTGESAVNYCFKQVPFAVEPGNTLTVTGLARIEAAATLGSVDDAKLQIIDRFFDPLVAAANTPLDTKSVDSTTSDDWQALTVSWTNTGTLRRLVWIRTIMRHATAYVDFCHKESDLPAAGNVLNSDTVNWVGGTLTLPDMADVLEGVDYGVGGSGSTGILTDPLYDATRVAYIRKVSE